MAKITDAEVELILSSGGDERLDLYGPEKLNLYGCSYRPVKQVSFSSCTASSVGEGAFEHVKAMMRNNRDGGVDWRQKFQSLRDRLRAIIGLDDDVDIALGASGTDLEIIATLSCHLKYGALTNIVMAPDEIGSGSLLAAAGKYFSNKTPLMENQSKSIWIEGFEGLDIDVDVIAARDEESGVVIRENELEKILVQRIDAAVFQKRTVLLHLVCASKTGLVVPSLKTAHKMKKKYGNHVQVVVDSCQSRISRDDVNKFLQNKYLLLMTGSKFFSGPPFSGALFVPKDIAEVFREHSEVPKGMRSIFTRSEFPFQWVAFDQCLSEQINFGLYYRWEAALYEMTLFYRTDPKKFAQTAQIFNEAIDYLVEKSGYLKSLTPDIVDEGVDEVSCYLFQTIKTVEIISPRINFETSIELHRALAKDDAFGMVQLGQPVKIKKNMDGDWAPTLRFAIGSSFFVENSGKVRSVQSKDIVDQLSVAIQKIEHYLNSWERYSV